MDNEELNSDSDNNKIEIELINVPKFVFLYILSLGLYGFWWIYKSWKFFKIKESSDIWPFPRTILSFFTLGLLFQKIETFASQMGSKRDLYWLYLAFIFSGIASYFLSDPYNLIVILTFIFLIPPLKALNFAIEESEQYIVKRRTGFNNRQIVLIVISGIFWVLTLLEIFGSAEEFRQQEKVYTSLEEAFANTDEVYILSLSKDQLTSLPESIGNLTNLQELWLDENQLTSLPESILNLTNLQTLWLRDNQLTSLPESILNLTNLQTLSLSGNQFTTLPEWIGNLTNLQWIVLDGNQLTSLPESIGNLTNLQTLSLSGNQFTTLPEWIGNLTNLQWIDLNGNQLTSLPESIGNLTNLQRLYLRENQLTSLPASIGNLKNLHMLWLSDNNLTEAEKKRIKKLLPNCEIVFSLSNIPVDEL